MSRTMTAAMVTKLTGAELSPALLVELQFDSGTLYHWSGDYSLAWNGQTWTGTGVLMSIGSMMESEEIKAAQVALTLTGQDPALISIAHDEPYQGRPVIIRFATVENDGSLTADPIPWFVGRMDVMEDADSGEEARFTLTCTNRLIDLDGASDRRLTPEDQKIDFPPQGSPEDYDKCFDQVTALQNLEISL